MAGRSARRSRACDGSGGVVGGEGAAAGERTAATEARTRESALRQIGHSWHQTSAAGVAAAMPRAASPCRARHHSRRAFLRRSAGLRGLPWLVVRIVCSLTHVSRRAGRVGINRSRRETNGITRDVPERLAVLRVLRQPQDHRRVVLSAAVACFAAVKQKAPKLFVICHGRALLSRE